MIFLSSTLLLLVPSLLAQGGDDLPDCESCNCPPVPAPATTACDTLGSYMDMMDRALMEGNCEGLAELEQPDEVCHAITMKAIPPCMLEEGTGERAECLAEAAEDIEEEMSGDESGADIVASCKCDAFRNIQESLTTVRDMMCPPGRGGHNYYPGYGYDATTIWFQYTLCQQQDLACWLFTSNWNQGDFGQYYLYDNLLGDDGLAGDNVLPLLLLGGGLGGGKYGGLGGGVYGGHGMQRYRREADCEGEDDCPAKPMTRRETNDCPNGKNWDTEAKMCVASKKRRDADCPSGKKWDAVAKMCVASKKRRDAKDCPSGKKWDAVAKMCVASRKRRETECPSEIYDVAGNCVRSSDDDVVCEYNVGEDLCI